MVFSYTLQATGFIPRYEPGGVAVDTHGYILVASWRTITYYSQNGTLIKSFSDDFTDCSKHGAHKGFEHIRKELAVGVDDQVYVSDPNTNSVRGN